MISLAIGFVLGALFGAWKPSWVRGVAGKARGVFFGARPALDVTEREQTGQERAKQATMIPSGNISEVSPTPPKNPIRVGEALKNVVGFFVGLIGWAAKNPIAVLALAILALWLTVGASCSGPFGKSKDALRLEREIAEMNETIRAHEARVNELSRELAVNTERDRTRRTQVIAQAQQEIEHAAAEVDPSALSDAYESRYLCVLDPSTCASGANPAPGGSAPVRGPDASPV